ncbi:unnamed protein product, partial [Amoebophrya sp. A25]
ALSKQEEQANLPQDLLKLGSHSPKDLETMDRIDAPTKIKKGAEYPDMLGTDVVTYRRPDKWHAQHEKHIEKHIRKTRDDMKKNKAILYGSST